MNRFAFYALLFRLKLVWCVKACSDINNNSPQMYQTESSALNRSPGLVHVLIFFLLCHTQWGKHSGYWLLCFRCHEVRGTSSHCSLSLRDQSRRHWRNPKNQKKSKNVGPWNFMWSPPQKPFLCYDDLWTLTETLQISYSSDLLAVWQLDLEMALLLPAWKACLT